MIFFWFWKIDLERKVITRNRKVVNLYFFHIFDTLYSILYEFFLKADFSLRESWNKYIESTSSLYYFCTINISWNSYLFLRTTIKMFLSYRIVSRDSRREQLFVSAYCIRENIVEILIRFLLPSLDCSLWKK